MENPAPAPFPWQAGAVEKFIRPYEELAEAVEAGRVSPEEAGARLAELEAEPILLLWDPRLGKTGTVLLWFERRLAVHERLKAAGVEEPEPRMLIVAPNQAARSTWASAQARMWLGRELPFIGGSFAERVHGLMGALGSPAAVTSYDFWSRRPDDEAFIREVEALFTIPWTVLVLDEVHELANPGALRTRNLSRVQLERLKRILLSGTLVRNRIDSVAAPLVLFAFPGELRLRGGAVPEDHTQAIKDPGSYRRASPEFGSMDALIRRYAVTNGYGRVVGGRNLDPATCTAYGISRCLNVPPGSPYDWYGTGRCKVLYAPADERARICARCPVWGPQVPETCLACEVPLSGRLRAKGASILRASDVLGECPVLVQVERVRFGEDQHELYGLVQNGVVAWREERSGQWQMVRYGSKLAVITALRLLALEPEQWAAGIRRAYAELKDFLPEKAFGRKVSSAKLDWLKEFVSGMPPGTKAAVFCEWQTTAHHWAAAFGEQAAALTGEETAKERSKLMARWEADPELRLLFCTSAAFQGIDLSAGGRAKFSVVAHPFWQAAWVRQAQERVWNPNVSESVTVIHLISEGRSGEETVEGLVYRRGLAKAADGRRAVGLSPDLELHGVTPSDIDSIIQEIRAW